MSLEDYDSGFESDESDDEPESDGSDAEVTYQELVQLYNQLMCFDHIYANNIMIDMEHLVDEAESSSDSDSDDDWSTAFHNIVIASILETVFHSSSSTSSSGDDSNTDDCGVSCAQDSVLLHEEATSSSCSTSSTDDADEQTTNTDSGNSLQGDVAEE